MAKKDPARAVSIQISPLTGGRGFLLRLIPRKDLGGRPRRFSDSQIRSAVRLIKGGEPAAQVAPQKIAIYRQQSHLSWRVEKTSQKWSFMTTDILSYGDAAI